MAVNPQRTLWLGGVELRCIDKVPAGLLLDIAEAMNIEAAPEIQARKALVAMNRLLRTVVIKEDQHLLEEVLYRTEEPVGFEDVSTAVSTFMAGATGRPFAPSSSSRNGGERTTGRSRVVSLSPDTKVEPPAPRDGHSVGSLT